MSTSITLRTSKLASCFGELTLLLPKGIKDMPVGISLQAGVLTFFHSYGLTRVGLDDKYHDCVEYCSIIYYDIADLLWTSKTEETTLEFQTNAVFISNANQQLVLRHGYGEVACPEFPTAGYTDIQDNGWRDTLHSMLNMGLEKLYMKAEPIAIADGTSIWKYPNTWIRCLTASFDLCKLLDSDHVRTLVKFKPESYLALSHDSILFKRGDSYMLLPCREIKELEETKKSFNELMRKLSEPVTLNLEHYTESIRSLSKVCSKPICDLTVYEKGLKTAITEGDTSMSVICGVAEKPIGTAQMPVNVWLTFLRALGNGMIQVMIGGDILCLRNQSLIILTHVRG